MSTEQKQMEPTVINLDAKNSVVILSQYVEVAQTKGAFTLNEAEVLKRASDYLINNVPDQELNPFVARQALIQGIVKGQRHGAYTLNDAALLSKVVQFVAANMQAETNGQTPIQAQQPVVNQNQESDDLSELAEPIPLKPKEI